MRTQPDTIGPLEAALDAREKGIVAIPCRGKVPLVKWKPFQTAMPPLETQMEWFRDCRVNVAIITTGMVLFDVDDPALRELVLEHCGPTPHVVHTPRGGTHFGYRARKGVEMQNRVKIKGHPIDIRTDGGIEVIPPSRTEHGAYEWLGGGLKSISELPVARIGWTRERKRRRIQTTIVGDGDPHGLLTRGRLYVDRFGRAVSGRGGHKATFVSALKIVRFVGGDAHLAWQLLQYYNATKCDPEWDERSLRHKWEDALKRRE